MVVRALVITLACGIAPLRSMSIRGEEKGEGCSGLPSACPAPITGRLTREVKAIPTSDDVKKHFLNNAMEIDYRDPNEFAVFIANVIKRWSGVVRKANISPDTQK